MVETSMTGDGGKIKKITNIMVYQINAKVKIEGDREIIKQVFRLESESPLTVKQIKEQCFAKIESNIKDYDKKSEEVRSRGITQEEASQDSEVFDKGHQFNPEYKLIVIKKK